MQMPFKKGSASTWEEGGKCTEFSTYQELQRAKENSSSAELYRAEELLSQKASVERKPKENAASLNPKILTAANLSLATVAATVAVTAIAIMPAKSVPPPVLPTFTMQEVTVGLNYFQGNLRIESYEGLTLTATLTNTDGERVAQNSVGADGGVAYENLKAETEYLLSVRDEEGVERFVYSFTTEPFVTLTHLEDGRGAKLALHSSISLDYDYRFSLFDAEGKDFSSNVYGEVVGEESVDGDGADSSIDYFADSIMEYYLTFDGLYEGGYTLQFTSYLPEDQEVVYEKSLLLGDLTPLVYSATVEKEKGQITLRYESGDLAPYTLSYGELYQNEEYYAHVEITDLGDTALTLPIDEAWASGRYSLYLIGVSTDETLYNQVVKIEIEI